MAGTKKLARIHAPADLEEAEALAFAVEALRGCQDAEAGAVHCISAWVRKRAEQRAGRGLLDNAVFNFGEARLQGIITAALPAIGEALSDLPADVAFFDLPKEDVIQALARACVVIRAFDLFANEYPNFPLDDAIPF